MKTLLRLSLAMAAFTASSTLRAEISAQAWLETYYLDPKPNEVPRAIARLSLEGYFDRTENVSIAIGFFATVFSDNADRVDDWLQAIRVTNRRHQRIIAAALWQAGHGLAAKILMVLARESPVRTEIERLAGTPAQLIVDTPVLSVSSMNLQWGAFLATGDQRYILNLLQALGDERPALGVAAHRALAQNAVAHPRVLEICRSQLARDPDSVRGVLRATLDSAAPAAPRS